MREILSLCRGYALLPILFVVLFGDLSAAAAQQVTPEAAAMMVLDSARRAYNEAKYDFAAERFREFLRQYGGHKDAPAANYGLALSLMELAQRDYPAAIAALQQSVGRQDFADRPYALYYLGAAQRGLGGLALEQALAKPNEANNFRNEAVKQFGEAAKSFSAAVEALTARVKTVPPPATPVDALEMEWLARARCDQCEMLLRVDKFKEVVELAKAFLADKTMEKSRFRELAMYQFGHACFATQDYLSAGRTLSQLTPFKQEFGVHARYLLARTHHLAGERPEATAQYKALLADYDQQKKMAGEAMKNSGALAPEQRVRLEALLKGPPPDYVLRAAFYTAVLQAEEGRSSEALEGLNVLLQQQPNSSIADEIKLRQGYCQLQLRNFAEAIKLLHPLHNHPQLGDRAMWWTARAQAGAADVNNAQQYEQTLRGACEMLNRAAERAGQMAPNDPEAKIRRGDILLEMGDTQQMGKQFREAAGTYQKVLSENNNPDRAEEAMQRLATAMHLAGQYKESDDLCQKFEQAYPKSILLAAVWFRAAENACMTATAAANDPNMRSRRPEVEKMLDEAITRYQRVIKKYPEFAYIHLARYGLATAFYHKAKHAEALAILAEIPEADRNGELAAVNYLMADCQMRLLPPETADAIQASQLIERAEQAVKLLEKYVMAVGKAPPSADALLKLGFCHQRVGMVLIDPEARKKRLTQARETYERLMQEFGTSSARPVAAMERARCLALLGDGNSAINELNAFSNDPLKQSPAAPLAMICLASLLRAQNRAADAVKTMSQCRSQYEAALQNDPERSKWIPLMQYEHALAVKETDKQAEARAMFEALAKQFAGTPEAANALWRAGQCRREGLLATLAAARQVPLKPGVKPEEITAATKSVENSLAELRQTAEFFKAEAARLAPAAGGNALKVTAATVAGEAFLSMLYETAWCNRALAEAEIEVARQKLQSQALEKVLTNWKKATPGQPPPALNPPEVAMAAVPPQPAETGAREQYRAMIGAAGNLPIGVRARLELAEMHAQRGENDPALEILSAAIEANPALDLAERVRLRMATCLLAKNDLQKALAETQRVLQNAASPLLGEARCLAGEIHIQNKDWNAAIEQLRPFRDQDPWRNMTGLVEPALLRLGFAFAQAQRWDESRQSMENLVQRFPQSPWVYKARFGMGWAWQNQNQHDQAANAYGEVTRGTAAEVAARAQLQIGLCRMAQKRYPDAAKELLVVSFTYDYPEQTAQALCEAGQAYLEMKQPSEAAKVLQMVLRDHPASKWAEVARQRLAGIK